MDLIDRQAAIEAIAFDEEMLRRVLDDMDVVGVDREKYEWGLGLIESLIYDIRELPSARPEPLTDKEQRDNLAARFRRMSEGHKQYQNIYHDGVAEGLLKAAVVVEKMDAWETVKAAV